MAILDTMMTGYYLRCPVDIYVETVEGGEPIFKWRNPREMYITRHSHAAAPTYPHNEHLDPNFLRWLPMWMIETEAGYSSLITHPINRGDLPFVTMTGIIDTDGLIAAGALPFNVKKGFQGIIKRGTPIAQVIPFKRDEWEMEITEVAPKRYWDQSLKLNSQFNGVYKEELWETKKYK